MAFSSGVFSRLYNFINDRDTGIKIRADRMDAELDGIATGLSKAILKDGTQTITHDIPFNDKKITGLADPASAQDGATKAYVDAQVSANVEFADSTFRIQDNSDATKKLAFQLSGLTTATTRTITVPDADGTLMFTSAIGSTVQAYSANLAEYAAVNPTTAGLALLDDASASDQRTTLGLVIGTNVQAYDAALDSLAGLSLSAGDILYATGSNTLARLAAGTNGHVLTLSSGVPTWAAGGGGGSPQTSFADNEFEITDNSDATKKLAFQLSGLTTATTRTITVPDADGTLMFTSAIGSTVQGYDALLASIAGLTVAQGGLIYATAADTVAALTKGSAGQMLVMNSGATAPEWGDPPASTVGKQTFYMPADAIRPSNTSGAERGIMETSTNKRIVPYLAFSPSAEEFAQFNVHMPKGWDEGTMTFQISWAHPSTTTNFGVAWGLEITGLGNDDALDTAWGTEVVVTDTGGTTSDVYITSISAPVTPGNSPGAEEWHSFRITRVVGNASDNMAVDAYLLGIKVHYTTNAATDD